MDYYDEDYYMSNDDPTDKQIRLLRMIKAALPHANFIIDAITDKAEACEIISDYIDEWRAEIERVNEARKNRKKGIYFKMSEI